MRVRARSVAALLLLLLTAVMVGAQPAVLRGPTSPGGPAVVTTVGATTTTTLIVPAALASDANCAASTLPTKSTSSTSVNTLTAAITCATPATTTNVVAVSFYVDGTGTTGTHQTCSVYTLPGGYVAGTTSVPKVAGGCDTVEWVAPNGTTSGWITLATTGTCTLAPSTRYQIACNQDATGAGYFLGYNSTACTVGGVQCNQLRGSVTYSGGPVPASWTANNQGTITYMYYLSVR